MIMNYEYMSKEDLMLLVRQKEHENMVNKLYLYIKGFAMNGDMKNTLKALAIAKELHEGQYRKSGIPYIVHPLKVAIELIGLGYKDDVLLAAALLHDVIEDCNLPYNGKEFTTEYGLDEEVLEVVQLVTKQKGLELSIYFNKIKNNRKALLVKIADRVHNISTMTGTFSKEKMKEYVDETYKYILPLCKYGKNYYPEDSNAICMIKYHILSICEVIEGFLSL